MTLRGGLRPATRERPERRTPIRQRAPAPRAYRATATAPSGSLPAMRRPTSPRRGNCLFLTLLGALILGVVLLIGGTITFFVSSPTTAVSDAMAKFEQIAGDSSAIEAPGTFEIELKAGGAAFFLSPDGKVGDKTIPTPPGRVMYTIAVRDANDQPIRVEPNQAPRQGNEPFYFFGFCQIPADGKYTIDVQASDGSTPAAILAAPATQEDLEALGKAALGAVTGGLGGCGAICGIVFLLVGGIGLIFVRKKAKPDPLAM